ncbi:hypothetical protein EW145_g5954 [Phellinidium pouzarii]|uniref:Anaphase-promoting complex subunit 5 n=1 Tax=Phellinidium pouzarii TaxID=167371 RepID=A0A4S4KYA8_9AGAM|nr:hypothetical protein EW145_g5954 [Phellinidium pouzarii]
MSLSLEYSFGPSILRSVYDQVVQPKSFEQLIYELDKGRQYSPDDCDKLTQKIRALPTSLQTTYRFVEFISDIPALWTTYEDEESTDQDPPFDKRSLFGLFARRVVLAFKKMSFLGVSNFVSEFEAWAAGDNSSGYQRIVRDSIKDEHGQMAISRWLEKIFADSLNNDLMAPRTRQFIININIVKIDKVNSVFRELRQHAMLNLVRIYSFNGQIAATRKLLQEAITVARTSGDNIVLQQCMALLRRSEGKTKAHKEPLNELQADIPPLEVLNDVGKLLRETQPISDAFEKTVQALGIYDLSRDFRGGPPVQQDQWAFHGMQSVLWRLAGCERLAIIEENIVLAFSDNDGPDDTRFTMLQNRTAMLARQGKEMEAFGVLLDPDTWRGLDYSLNEVAHWSGEMWITMINFASRRGQQNQVNSFLKSRRPGFFRCFLQKVNQGITSVDHILKALWQSEYQGRFRLYRLAAILLADVGLEFGMTVWSRRLAEEVMPQIISGDDLELRAFACYVLARCIIACSGKNTAGLRDAIPYLHIAEQDYRTLAIYSAVQDVLYVLAIVHNDLGDQHERDSAAALHVAATIEQRRLEAVHVSEYWEEIWDLTIDISTALTSRK